MSDPKTVSLTYCGKCDKVVEYPDYCEHVRARNSLRATSAASAEKQSLETVSRPLCSTCRFWQRGEDTPLEGGECRIRAPGKDSFPISFDDDWCGEHKALPSRPSPQWTDAELVRFATHDPYGRSDP